MDISIPISKLNEALRELVECDFDEAELRAECETAIDNALPPTGAEPVCTACNRAESDCSRAPCEAVQQDRAS